MKQGSICIVTPDFVGLTRNGGIGTAYYNLAIFLTKHGFNVTVFYVLGQFMEEIDYSMEEVKSYYHKLGIKLIPLSDSDGPTSTLRENVIYSLRTAQWLIQQDFDLIHFPDWRGIAYFSCLYKITGQGLTNTTICIDLHSPTKWHRIFNEEYSNSPEQCQTDFLEQHAVAMSDTVISPSQYMISWYLNNNWPLPESRYVIPNLLEPAKAVNKGNKKTLKGVDLNEIVFFGRLEIRKGVKLFCKALQQIPTQLLTNKKITFLGKESLIDEQPSSKAIHQLLSGTSISWNIIGDLDTYQAIDYLRKGKKLTVIPSLVENSPYVVLESIINKIYFITTDSGGTAELIHEDDRDAILFLPTVAGLAEKLEQIFYGQFQLARPAIALDTIQEQWLHFHTNYPKPQRSDIILLTAELQALSDYLLSLAETSFSEELQKQQLLADKKHLEGVIHDLRLHLGETLDRLSQASSDITLLQKENNKLRIETDKSRAEIHRSQAEIYRLEAEIENIKHSHEIALSDLKGHHELQLEETQKNFQKQLDMIFNSLSWKITKPLRFLKRLITE